MKKYLLFLAVLAFVAACAAYEMEVNEKEVTANALPAPSIKPDAFANRSHKIPLDSVALLVSNAFNNESVSKVLSSYAFGGTFPAKLFRVLRDSSGIILWSCFTGGKQPEYFLALEQLKSYDVYNLPKAPTSKSLARSLSSFKDIAAKLSTASSARTFIENHTIARNGALSIDNASVVKSIKSFDSLMAATPDVKGKKYNEHPFAYFRESTDGTFSKFLDQAGPNGFVRYYFAYDETEKPNRIRVVLVAVDATGKNITRASTNGRTSGDEALFLQKSFPPPPYN